MSRNYDRRSFLGHAGKAAAAAALTAAGCASNPGGAPVEIAAAIPIEPLEQAASTSPVAPGEKIRLGFIGVGGRGRNLLQRFMETGSVEIMALCDVKQDALDEAFKMTGASIEGQPVSREDDYRKLLERNDIDAVVIATPDHWHAINTIDACKAGKDVYVEKPLALCVAEGRRMVQAARKHGRIVQMGTQQVSGERYKKAKDAIQGGKLGKVTMARVWNYRNSLPRNTKTPDTAAPPTINWDRWVGPRPLVPYNAMKSSGAFRHFWDYAGGILTDWGTHHFHTILDIMGYDQAPLHVCAASGRYVITDSSTVPDNLSVLYQFKDWTMEYSSRETNGKAPYDSEYGIEFCGTDAAMFLDRRGYMIFSEKDRARPEILGAPGKDNFLPTDLDETHTRDWLECIRTRERPNSEVEGGHKATILSHLGNIACRVGRQIRWDPIAESIPGDAEADALLRREYRSPYLLPEA